MKLEVIEFLIHTQGYNLDVLHMKAPYGETVIDPKSSKPRWFERHQYEMKQRFPHTHYRYYPKYTMGSGMAAWAWRNSMMTVQRTPVVAPLAIGVAGQTVAVKELAQSEVAEEHPWWIAWIFGTR